MGILPDARQLEAGHLVHEEQPGATAKLVEDFLGSLKPSLRERPLEISAEKEFDVFVRVVPTHQTFDQIENLRGVINSIKIESSCGNNPSIASVQINVTPDANVPPDGGA